LKQRERESQSDVFIGKVGGENDVVVDGQLHCYGWF
jgi:hypothetical protein